MEQETLLKEIINALKLHSEHVDDKISDLDIKIDNMTSNLKIKMDNMKSDLEKRMDEGFVKVDHQFDQLGKKVDGIRSELNETQETVDYSAGKIVQHEKKLRQLNLQKK